VVENLDVTPSNIVNARKSKTIYNIYLANGLFALGAGCYLWDSLGFARGDVASGYRASMAHFWKRFV